MEVGVIQKEYTDNNSFNSYDQQTTVVIHGIQMNNSIK